MKNSAKRTHGPGHYTGRVIDWCMGHWFKLCLVLLAAYSTYSIHVPVGDFETVGQRILDFSSYLHERLEKEGTLT